MVAQIIFGNMQNELKTICHLHNINLPLSGRINCDAVLWDHFSQEIEVF